MSINTKAIIRKGTTIVEIMEVLKNHFDCEATIHATYSDDFFYISFNVNEDEKRRLNIFLTDTAKNDYDIDGVLLDLGCHGSSVKIMKTLLVKFGGYLDENDCDDKDFYPINLIEFKKGKDFSTLDLFTTKVIQKLGYENLKVALELFSEFKEIKEKPQYTHDCNNCIFLGQYENFDLYYCNITNETVIARYGNEGSEYMSGIGFANTSQKQDNPLYEAKQRAIKKGLIVE